MKNKEQENNNVENATSKLIQKHEVIKVTDRLLKVIEKYFFNEDLREALKQLDTEIFQETVSNAKTKEDRLCVLFGYSAAKKKIKNTLDVVERAEELILEENLEDKINPEQIEEDWFSFFFEKAQLVSDEKMQQLWGQLLKGEMLAPGSISLSLIHSVSIMSQKEAQDFCNICRFCFHDSKDDVVHPFIFLSKNVEAYKKSKITVDELKHLERLGLIDCEFGKEYIFRGIKKLSYGNHIIELYGKPEYNKKIQIGNVILTDSGQQLYKMVDEKFRSYNQSILDFTIQKLIARNCIVKDNGRMINKE